MLCIQKILLYLQLVTQPVLWALCPHSALCYNLFCTLKDKIKKYNRYEQIRFRTAGC